MNEIQIFNNPEFGEIRSLEVNGEPWFVGRDIATVLGYAKPENAIANHVDEEDKTTTLIQGTGTNYKSKAVIINESGLYSLILSSKLPKAKEFKHWVTAEVIPSIRKTGKYIAPNVPDMDKLSLTTQCLINLEITNSQLRKDLDGAIKRIEELESRNEITEPEEQPAPKKPRPQGKPWSEREKDYLRRAYALGQTDTEIAAELGRTVDSIHNKRRVLGLVQVTRPHWSKDEDKKLKRLLNKGLTAPEISALIGRSADGVLSRKSKLRQKGVKI